MPDFIPLREWMRKRAIEKFRENPGRLDRIFDAYVAAGVRPFVQASVIRACLAGVLTTGACIPAIGATDTIKQIDENGVIIGTLDRKTIQLAQTPQTFSLDLIRRAHQLASQSGFTATDDASVAEFAGARVIVVPGDRDNIKITTPADLPFARAILERWRQPQ